MEAQKKPLPVYMQDRYRLVVEHSTHRG